ncbi:MAG: hypothetical protein ABI333_00540 [bacterium]
MRIAALLCCVGALTGCSHSTREGNLNNVRLPVCGNGVVEATEQCDGSDLGGRTCDLQGFDGGRLSCSGECLLDTRECHLCGDGLVNGPEQCDGTALQGQTCADLGFVGGTLGCSAGICEIDTSGCHDCGNGLIDAGEVCDGTNVDGSSCQSMAGLAQGDLACSPTCLAFDTTGCHQCGNGLREGPEGCDGSDLGSASCLSETGHTEGSLACLPDCSLDTDACHTCGDGNIGGGELCDGAEVGIESCLSQAGLPDGALTCLPGCAAYDTSECHTCGDGVLDGPETCEDGNAVDWDGCTDCFASEFQVNTFTVDFQHDPDVAMLGGGFLIVWQSGPPAGAGQDGDGYGVFGRRFDSTGLSLGGELQINTHTTGDQWHPKVAASGSADIVVVWESAGQDGSGWGVFGQRLDSYGAPLGSEFQINTETANDQRLPAVAMAVDGSFVVVWQSDDGSGSGVFSRRYDSAGNALGVELQVNTHTPSDQRVCEIAMNDSGEHVVVWMSWLQDGDAWGVFGQRFDPFGDPAGAEFQVNSYTVDSQRTPAVAMTQDGSFVVVWSSDSQDEDGSSGVYGQRYDSNGGAVGGEFPVSTFSANSQERPAVAMFQDGGFVVVWESWMQDGNMWGVYSQRIDGSGSLLGNELRLNSYVMWDQRGPRLASADSGGHVVTWQSMLQDGDEWGIFAQRYGVTGTPLGVGP